MKIVTFIGFGEIGRALASLIDNRFQVRAWDQESEKVTPGIGSIEEAVAGADVVFLCVPSWVVRGVTQKVAKSLATNAVVVSLAKGLEKETLKTIDAVLEEILPKGQPSGVLGGPLLAEELLAGLSGIGVLGIQDSQAFVRVAALFEGTALLLEYEKDSTAVAFSSVLKNIYAVAVGIADGLGWGWNGKGWLAAKALFEMESLVERFGHDARVVRGTAGAGDFLATSLSPDSFNSETGRQIALTGECTTQSEGCRAVEDVFALLGDRGTEFQILSALNRIINLHENPKTVFQNLLSSG